MSTAVQATAPATLTVPLATLAVVLTAVRATQPEASAAQRIIRVGNFTDLKYGDPEITQSPQAQLRQAARGFRRL